MTQCKTPDIAERLAASLAPDEFPEEAALIHAHLGECDACRKELHELTEMERFLRAHKDVLAEEMGECPAPETLVDHALGRLTDSDVTSHVQQCTTCEAEVFLIRELDREAPVAEQTGPSAGEKLVIQTALSRTFGVVEQARETFFEATTRKLTELFSFPSFAVGAAAAAVLVLLLIPGGHRNGSFQIYLSDVRWDGESGGLMPKSIFAAPSGPEKKTIAVIFVGAASQRLSQEQLDELYGQVDIRALCGESYVLISPRDVRMLLGDKPEIADLGALPQEVFHKMQTDLLLLVKLSSRDEKFALDASLVRRGDSLPHATMSFAGVERERVAARVSMLGRALLESESGN